MHMHWVDWSIIIALLTVLVSAAIYTSRYTRSVSDFLAANRSAGRYLICVADGMAGLGAITIVMMFEMYYEAGFPVVWWDMARLMIIPTVLSLTGWVIYRFRQTRALTLAQFFEMRYSRNFRVFAGLLTWFSGIVNFGIFPAVGARFFINFWSLPDTMLIYIALMVVLLALALFFTFIGGHIAVMVTDFLQGIFCSVVFIILTVFILNKFSWDQVVTAMSSLSGDASRIHPFKVGGAVDFNPTYYFVVAFIAAYGFMSWQGAQGYNAAARSPHESRMGKSLSVFRMLALNAFALMVPIGVYTFLHHPDFAVQAQGLKATIASIDNEVIRKQAVVTIGLSSFLPVGLMGAFCAVVIAAFIGNCDTYLHSWGSIFIQDVVLPFRKKTLSPSEHLKWLRLSILGVAVFILLFSIFFKQTEYIIMFFNITGAIFIGGAGSVIIGGLYWKRGTTAGAWAGMITGAILAVGAILLQQIHAIMPFNNHLLSYIASRNGSVLAFWAAIGAVIAYVSFSLLGKKQLFDLNKMLHREETEKAKPAAAKLKGLSQLFSFSEDFNFRDKLVYLSMVIWISLVVLIFVGVTVYNIMFDVPDSWWAKFWHGYIWVCLVMGSIVTVWFAIGGARDLKQTFTLLENAMLDDKDDGRVLHTDTEDSNGKNKNSDHVCESIADGVRNK